MKKNRLLAIVSAITVLCASAASFSACSGEVHHLTKVKKENATCTENGTEAYYVCDDCKKMFSDSLATKEISAPVVITATGHVSSAEASCTVAKTCDDCGEEITAATGHSIKAISATAATCTVDGCVAHYACENCEDVFYDANGKSKTTKESVTLKASHSIDLDVWQYDEDSHYHGCDNCDEEKDKAEHQLETAKNHVSHWKACYCGYTTVKEAHVATSLDVEVVGVNFLAGNKLQADELKVKGVCSCGEEFVLTEYEIEDKEIVAGENSFVITAGNVSDTATLTAKAAPNINNPQNLVHFTPAKENGQYFENVAGTTNGTGTMKVQMVTYNGLPAATYTIGKNTAVNSAIGVFNNASASNGRNCNIPMIANVERTVILYAVNNGNETVKFRFGICNNGAEYGKAEVTVAAGATERVTFTAITSTATLGNNFTLTLLSSLTEDASITLYGYFYCASEISKIEISNAASKTTFKVGETFSSQGLMLKPTGSQYDRVYVYTNIATDYDNHVFTADDIGTKTVTVSFGGVTCTYNITVTA
ncbi:MAG: hypothetical protein J6B04_02790 [Clostridia bacterium]|nr:hypothetical protein [Clostridia bacterium]